MYRCSMATADDDDDGDGTIEGKTESETQTRGLIVLLHGAGYSSMTWGRMLTTMAECWKQKNKSAMNTGSSAGQGPSGWQMWAVDFRGHGESTAEASDDRPLSKQVLVDDTLVSESEIEGLSGVWAMPGCLR